jgi:hypothetical protein
MKCSENSEYWLGTDYECEGGIEITQIHFGPSLFVTNYNILYSIV